MNYFEFYGGDYLRDTSRLSLTEHGAYLKLMIAYYGEEQALPAAYSELYTIAVAISDADQIAVRKVADKFFPVAADGLRHKNRIDEEITKARKRIDSARANGGRGGRPPKTQQEPSGKPSGFSGDNPAGTQPLTHSGEALQTPHAIHKQQEQKQGGKPPLDLPDWLPTEVWALWHDFRNSRKGWTSHARKLSLRTLSALWAAGNDPRAVIEQSIERGYTGLFEVKRPQARAGPSAAPGKTMQALQTLEAMKNGLVDNRNSDRVPEVALLESGKDAGR